MEKSKVIGKIHEIGILPVLRADSVEQAIDLAEAIEAGGVNSMEVTMTVPGALEVIRTLAAQPGLLVGAAASWTRRRRVFASSRARSLSSVR